MLYSSSPNLKVYQTYQFFGRTTAKTFLPNVSHFVLGSHTSAVDPDFSNENLAETGFDRLPQDKDNIKGRGREGHTRGQRDGDACLLQNLTQSA